MGYFLINRFKGFRIGFRGAKGIFKLVQPSFDIVKVRVNRINFITYSFNLGSIIRNVISNVLEGILYNTGGCPPFLRSVRPKFYIQLALPISP